MWKTFKACLVIERSNKSNLYSLLFVAILIVGFMFVASRENYDDPIVDTTTEYQATSSAMSKFQIVDISTGDNTNSLLAKLTRLRQAISLKIASFKMEMEDLSHKSSLKIIDIRDSLYDTEDFKVVESLVKPKIHNENERVFVNALMEREVIQKQEPLQYWQFILIIFSIIGFAWFPFLSFYTSGIMIEDFRHTTIIKGYPVRFDQYVIAKSVTKILMIISFIALIFIISLPLIQLKGVGVANYPVIVYNGTPHAYTIPQYVLICLGIMLVITIFTLLLSIIFNMIFKNLYITLFIQVILYFLPILFPSLISILPYNPFNFLNFNMILEGGTLGLSNPVDVTFIDGFITLGICIVIMLFIVQRFLSTGKLKRA
jgi:hypothetical protein